MSQEEEKTSIEDLEDSITEDFSNLNKQIKVLENKTEKKDEADLPKAQPEWTNMVGSTKKMFGKWQTDWKKTHQANLEKMKENQEKQKRSQINRRNKRKEKQQKINQKVEKFFQSQQKLFEDKIRQLESQTKERQAKDKQRIKDRQDRVQQQKDERIKNRELRKAVNPVT